MMAVELFALEQTFPTADDNNTEGCQYCRKTNPFVGTILGRIVDIKYKHYPIRFMNYMFLSLMLFISGQYQSIAQSVKAKKHVLVDIAHGEKFWNDPSKMSGMDPNVIERVKYMTTEITKSANSVNADIGYVIKKITATDLASCNLLFIHIPSTTYSADEAKAINEYVQKGGALFIVMDADYWSTLTGTNANAIVAPMGITFAGDSPDSKAGGHTTPTEITDKRLKVTYHGARMLSGGTPFCFNDETEQAFGVYKKVGKGKVIAMGDGMISLYMTEWQGVKDYQCSEFMHESFAWLLK
ncbi:MAG: hypothetical protein ABI477_23280 [Chryseolinea sp.]